MRKRRLNCTILRPWEKPPRAFIARFMERTFPMTPKISKTDHLSAITLAYLKESKKPKRQDEFKRLRVLLDSGCTATLVNSNMVKHLKKSIP